MFSSWCWQRLLRILWTARRSNQSILKEINPECSLEGLMLKLKLQYFGHLIQRNDSLEKTWCWDRLRTGGGADRGWDGWMASPTQWTWIWANSRRQWRTGKHGMLLWGHKESDRTLQLNNNNCKLSIILNNENVVRNKANKNLQASGLIFQKKETQLPHTHVN